MAAEVRLRWRPLTEALAAYGGSQVIVLRGDMTVTDAVVAWPLLKPSHSEPFSVYEIAGWLPMPEFEA